jgi:hypothetical protein
MPQAGHRAWWQKHPEFLALFHWFSEEWIDYANGPVE